MEMSVAVFVNSVFESLPTVQVKLKPSSMFSQSQRWLSSKSQETAGPEDVETDAGVSDVSPAAGDRATVVVGTVWFSLCPAWYTKKSTSISLYLGPQAWEVSRSPSNCSCRPRDTTKWLSHAENPIPSLKP